VNARYNLGVALLRDPDQLPRAINQFEAILRMRPDFDPAQQMLRRLRAQPR